MTLPFDALKACAHCADITNSVLKPDDPRRQWLPALRDLLSAQITMSRSRHELASQRAQLDPDELINAAQAADITGLSKRQVQRNGHNLGGQIIGGRWLFRRSTVEEHTR